MQPRHLHFLRGHHASRVFLIRHADLAFQHGDRGRGHLPGVVVRVPTYTNRADDRHPARQAFTQRTLRDLDADLLGDTFDHAVRHAAKNQAIAQSYHQIAERLRGSVPEQAPQHLLAAQFRMLAVRGGDVTDQLCLDFPDRNQFRQDRQPAERARRQGERAGGHRGALGRAIGQSPRFGLRIAVAVYLAVGNLADEVQDRPRNPVAGFVLGDDGREIGAGRCIVALGHDALHEKNRPDHSPPLCSADEGGMNCPVRKA